MKRLIAMLCLVLIACSILILPGCTSEADAEDPSQHEPDAPAVHELITTMYCTEIVTEDNSTLAQFEAELDLTISENMEGSDSFDLKLTFSGDPWYDYAYPENSFTIQHEELGLPYYCAKAYIYQPNTDGYMPFDFAVDLEKEYMIYKISANVTPSYIVASSDPDVDPMEIAEHFSVFLHIYDYSYLDDGNVSDIYYDLYGTWLSEDGRVLGEMDFYITGTLPAVYEDGDAVELSLDFIWPESFGYRNEGRVTYTGYVNIAEENHNHPNFHGTGTLYDSETNEPVSFDFNIFPITSTVVIHVNGQYLLGNLRELPEPEARLNYYMEFIYTTTP